MNTKVILRHLDLRNLELHKLYRENEPDRKQFDQLLAYMLPLWMSGTLNGRDQLNLMVEFNRHVNLNWWQLQNHPVLQAKILAAIGPGRVLQHDYHVRRSKRITRLMDMLARRYPDIRQDEIQLWCSKNSEATLLEMCRNYGIQEQDREPIINEYRNLVS